LIFRYPNDDPAAARQYYNGEYAEQTIVQMPAESALQQIREQKFRGTPFDKSARIAAIGRFTAAGSRILDFGCSWGYGVAQVNSAGFDAVGFEPGGQRAAYGRKHLGVTIETDWPALVRSSVAAQKTSTWSTPTIRSSIWTGRAHTWMTGPTY
jgi:hypothetical protein